MKKAFGVITEILDPDLYTILVDIPGENTELKAFPKRGEVDEPRVGDVVWLEELDPQFHSYYLYEKLKENNFIGIRARGKIIKFSQEEISIGIIDPGDESWYDDNSGKSTTPEPTSYHKLTSSGDQNTSLEGSRKVVVTGDDTLEISGSWNIKVSGSANINISGDATINSPSVTITGGQLTVSGTAAPSGSGPFCGIPVCPFSGAPHVGNIVSGT